MEQLPRDGEEQNRVVAEVDQAVAEEKGRHESRSGAKAGYPLSDTARLGIGQPNAARVRSAGDHTAPKTALMLRRT
jgi:hypothetical protein